MVMKRAIAEYNDYYNNKRLGGFLLIPKGYKKEQKTQKCNVFFYVALLRCT